MQGKGNYKSGKNFLWITRPKEPRGTSRHIPHFKQETHFKQNTDSSQHVTVVTLHKLHSASKFPVQVRCPLKMHCVLCSWCITVNQWKNLEWIICTTQCSSVQFKGEPGSEQEVMSPPPHHPLRHILPSSSFQVKGTLGPELRHQLEELSIYLPGLLNPSPDWANIFWLKIFKTLCTVYSV